jgi:hypothetical protein
MVFNVIPAVLCRDDIFGFTTDLKDVEKLMTVALPD